MKTKTGDLNVAISRVGANVDVTMPAWLYELLPFIYLIAGTMVFLSLSGALSVLSSALLFAAGIQVLLMRSRYRRAIRHPRRVPVRARR